MSKRCTQPDCPAPRGLCKVHFSNEHPKCEHWRDEQIATGSGSRTTAKGQYLFPWQGAAMEPKDIALVSARSSPVILGMIGTADAGKTSYLSMLFCLLLNGWRFDGWQFSGSYTLSAWESLAQYMTIKRAGRVSFPPPTPSNPDFYSFYHLALRHENRFRDVLFADSSGEVFKRWSTDTQDNGAENARWIYAHSSAFVLFVDCAALVVRMAQAVFDICQMAEQLATNLDGRPVAIVWSKSDRLADIPTTIQQSLREDLYNIFGNVDTYEVSNFSTPGQDPGHFNDNLVVITDLLSRIHQKTLTLPAPADAQPPVDDYFLNYHNAYARH
ncbi:TRAFAC clade GTPase domain-containing protein [Chitinophaga sp. 22620]|uniref:TRAFAC clade GTPase domain-containing protein n=1 Tax=Chitinophaga sp. 22620 TaxID=3453952 RepID=UPI003F834D65